MSKTLVAGGLAAVVVLSGAWAGTTWYSGQKVERFYKETFQAANKNSISPISYKITSYERGFLSSKVNWEANVVLDPCQPDSGFVLTGYDNVQQGFIPSLGWASIDTHIIWPDALQSTLKDVFGTKEPLKIHSRVNLLGNVSSKVSSPAVEWANEAVKLSWAGLNADLSIAGQKKLELDFEAPKLTVKNVGSASNEFALEKIQYKISQADYNAPFSDGSASFKADSLLLNVGGNAWALKSLHFGGESATKNDLLALQAIYNIDKIELNKKDIGDFKSKFSLSNVKASAATQAYNAFAHLQKQCNPAPDLFINALKPVLKNGFSVKLENADLKLFDGHAKVNGGITVPALTDADLQAPITVAKKVAANGVLQVSNKLLVGIFNQANQLKGQPAGSPAEAQQAIDMLMQGGIQQGFVSKTADGYQTIFAFKDGQPLVNGKPLAASPVNMSAQADYHPQAGYDEQIGYDEE